VIKNPSLILTRGDQINSKDYKAYYDSSLINLVAELYLIDVKMFNYNFDNTHNKLKIVDLR